MWVYLKKLEVKMSRISPAVDKFFPVVVAGKSNTEVFEDLMGLTEVRDTVVEHLRRIGPLTNKNFWWRDNQLVKLFNDLYKSGIVPFPPDPVDRIRWIALLCLEFANEKDFKWENIILPMDFLPDDMFGGLEKVYDVSIFIRIFRMRKRLADLGWEAYFWENFGRFN